MHFWMPMQPPTATHQQKRVRIINGKPSLYEPPEVREARAKLTAHLAQHRPEQPLSGAVRLLVKWCFPATLKHPNGTYHTLKPDTDNLQKLFKDVMTDVGFWRDDAQVACEIVEKFWANKPGIWVEVESIPVDGGV